jgi:DNA (cytosine-5)-methyltransferase 3A
MNVLSLFDGMSCAQLALQRSGIKVDKYYASEVDKYAIEITQKNFPNTIQVGDVTKLKAKDFKDIDLIVAGSPCQGFSFAGKQLAFDDPRSALFFEFIRLLKEIKPKYFLLENVRMKKEFIEVITQQVSDCYPDHQGSGLFPGLIEPILINSALLSAQSRQRLYWTNIPNVEQPEDLGIVLKDILLDDYETEKDKSYCIDANYYKGASVEQYKKKSRRQLVSKKISDYNLSDKMNKRVRENPRSRAFKPNQKKSGALLANQAKTSTDSLYALSKPKQVGKVKDGGQGNRIYSADGKSSALSSQSGGTAGNGNTLVETKPKQVGVATDIKGHDILKRVYSEEGKSPTLNSMGGGNREPKVMVKRLPKGSSGKSWFFEQQTYMEDTDKTGPLKSSSGSGNIPKVVTGGRVVGRAYDKDGKRSDRFGDSVAGKTEQMLELRQDKKSNALTTAQKDSLVVTEKSHPLKENYYKSSKANFENDTSKGGKFSATGVQSEDLTWRKLLPIECERLQTVPDNYTEGVSNTQRYRMLGNGFTVSVISHIFNNIK